MYFIELYVWYERERERKKRAIMNLLFFWRSFDFWYTYYLVAIFLKTVDNRSLIAMIPTKK